MGKLAVQKLYLFFRHSKEKILPNHGGDVRCIETWLQIFWSQENRPLPKSVFWSILKNQKIDQKSDFRAPVGFEIALGVFAARIFLYLNDSYSGKCFINAYNK